MNKEQKKQNLLIFRLFLVHEFKENRSLKFCLEVFKVVSLASSSAFKPIRRFAHFPNFTLCVFGNKRTNFADLHVCRVVYFRQTVTNRLCNLKVGPCRLIGFL